MERHFETALKELKGQLVVMAGLVERQIDMAIQALQTRDRSHITRVKEIEVKVNEAHKSVDEECVKLLALQQPLAADLRLIISVIKINTDLERMGDQAVNIANNTERYLGGEAIKELVDLPRMFSEVMQMVRETIDAFVRGDIELANRVMKLDDSVDALKNKIFRDVIELMKQKPAYIEQGLNLILIARNLERIGDHATNISEDVIYFISGRDVRHAGNGY